MAFPLSSSIVSHKLFIDLSTTSSSPHRTFFPIHFLSSCRPMKGEDGGRSGCPRIVCLSKKDLGKKIRPLNLKEMKLLKRSRSSSFSCSRVQAVMKEKEDSESEEYEIDTDKAREALQKLDQQLQSLSTKQISSPKPRASEMKFEEAERMKKNSLNMREKGFEISDSFLGYTAAALVLFTIFYNFLFYTVIAPSIDGP